MNQRSGTLSHTTLEGEPTWDIAYLFPLQGSWSEGEYLALGGNYLVEFDNGVLEVLPMPTMIHQRLVLYLSGLLLAFTSPQDLGEVLIAPMKVRLGRGKFREPDILFMREENADRMGNKFWKGADLVMEIVSDSPEDRERDLVEKRRDYAWAGVPEYWLVDPQTETITVLRLTRKHYKVHGAFAKGDLATSHLLPGFTVDVSEAFARSQGRKGKAPRKPKP